MKQIDSLQYDAVNALTEDEIRVIKDVVFQKDLNVNLAGKTLIPVRQVPNGLRSAGFQRVRTSEDDTIEDGIVATCTDFPSISVDGVETPVPIQQFGRSFRIPNKDILSSRMTPGMPLDTTYVESAKMIVDNDVDRYVWFGSTRLGIEGIQNNSANATYTATTWDTDPYSDLRLALNEMDEEFAGRNYAFISSRANISEMYIRDSSTGDPMLKWIKEQLSITPYIDKFFEAYAPNEGLLMPLGKDIAEIRQAEPQQVELEYRSAHHRAWEGILFEEMGIAHYRPEACVRIDGLTFPVPV